MKRALISVSDKTGIVKLAKFLKEEGWQIISTGGTAKILKEAGIEILPVEKVTGNPEVFDGRIKTISFQIESAILFDRENPQHQREAQLWGIEPIDLVVCNLYPFEKVAQKDCSLKTAIENIDIGGPTMIRAAAKNYKNVIVVIDPNDYPLIIHYLKTEKEVPFETRLELARKVFLRMAYYDLKIGEFLERKLADLIKERSKEY